jgi:phosphatidylglycerophosphate synthase
MHHAENVLVVTLFILLSMLTLLLNIVRPKLGLRAWYLGEGREFDKSRLSRYIALLIATAIVSALYGYLFSKSVALTLQFAGGCLVMVAVAGINLILYRNKKV